MLIGFGIFWIVPWVIFVTGLWAIFMGLFLGQAARGAAYQTAVLSKIEGCASPT